MLGNKNVIALHLIYWLFSLADVMFLSNYFAQQGSNVFFPDNPLHIHYLLYHFLSHFPVILLTALFFYMHLLWLVPYFLRKKKYITYLVVTLTSIVAVYLPLRFLIENYYFRWIGGSGMKNVNPAFWITDSSGYIIRYCFIAVAYYLTWRWMFSEKEKQELKAQNLATELAYLRNQVNPHFFFNTLSNIYSLAYTGSKETPAAILKLSEIMRYVLYTGNQQEVSLEEEIDYLNNYLALQKLQYEKEETVRLIVSGACDHIRIAPLLLIPFIENIFKHGDVNKSPATVEMICEPDRLVFRTENLKFEKNNRPAEGIGISNVKRRLELLYHGKYLLHIINDSRIYRTELILLNS